jgi:tetratricopeptide (TPR) repeat protein
VYAFGVMLYELFCGRLPFECGNSLKAWQRAHREQSAPEPTKLNGGIPEELAALMMKCVAKEAGARPRGFGDLGRQMAVIYQHESRRDYATVRTKPSAVELTAEAQKGQAWAKVRLGQGSFRRGDPRSALREFEEAEAVFRELSDPNGIATTLECRAMLAHGGPKDPKEAYELLKQQIALCRASGNQRGLARGLGNAAVILQENGQLEPAIKLHEQVESLCRELNDKIGLSRSLINQAVILHAWSRFEDALKVQKKAEVICRQIGDNDGLSLCLGNQAVTLRFLNRFEEALELHKQQETLCRASGNQWALASCLVDQALILGGQMRRPGQAWPLAEEAAKLFLISGNLARALEVGGILSRLQRGEVVGDTDRIYILPPK